MSKGLTERALMVVILFLISTTLIAGSVGPTQHFTITAKRFSYQPDEITVRKGTPVALELTSLDVTHGLKCKELGINATIHKGETTKVEFTPLEAGHFIARCSHFCGIGHGSMRLTINVVDQ